MVGISSPYRRVGLIHAKHKKYFATDSDDTLVVQGTYYKTLDQNSCHTGRPDSPSEWTRSFAWTYSFLDDELIDVAVDLPRYQCQTHTDLLLDIIPHFAPPPSKYLNSHVHSLHPPRHLGASPPDDDGTLIYLVLWPYSARALASPLSPYLTSVPDTP